MCTIFHSVKPHKTNLIGKNFDVNGICPISIFINKKGVEKTAAIKPPDIPAKWRSVFGSLSFNAVGSEFPVCGINEMGLVVEQTTLWNTTYSDRDTRPAVKELQWIQMMLDTCSSVEDVLEKQKKVRISQTDSKLQFLITDKSGKRALIEYIVGKCIIHREDSQDFFVIANDMLETSKDYLSIHVGYGGSKKISKSDMSIDRFVVTYDRLQNGDLISDHIAGFELLSLSQYNDTKWQVVYDINSLTVYINNLNDKKPYSIELKSQDFESTKCPEYMDLYSYSEFSVITKEDNLSLMLNFFSNSYIAPYVKVKYSDITLLNENIIQTYKG